MKEPHRKELATHPDPESCADGRKVGREALTGESAGQPLNCEIQYSRVPTPWSEAEGITGEADTGKASKDSAQSQTLSMHGHLLHENRDVPGVSAAPMAAERSGKAEGRTPDTNAPGKSDSGVVPMNPSNEPANVGGEEKGEGRPLASSTGMPHSGTIWKVRAGSRS